ncbi:MAG: hypothetical protein QF441_13220 [Bacteriovoracaceae bacterium]|jgi:hypothetical protein|nr:hypothetical protein [Halobacteriovoraceae bacterium]MDP7321566.1 hypothetical protein [Bacteriovoracaceae bacterium]|tara:strand:+ start:988 stop:1266 length:279 start_codon:yes stop_codon:yes gene_type:complete
MNLKKFTIITRNEAQQIDEKTNILINLEHIVSVKPIKLSTAKREVIDGYWIRLSNGKKYRAIQVPKLILEELNQDLPAIKKSDELNSSFNYQ